MTGDGLRASLGAAAVFVITLLYTRLLHVTNGTTVSLTFLLVVLVVAATSRLWAAVTTSLVALFCFNFFFLPPVGTLNVADPENWLALAAFLAVSVVGSNLSSAIRERERSALQRRDEMARLFDVSRDVLLVAEREGAPSALVRSIVARFELDYAALGLFESGEWDIVTAGRADAPVDRDELTSAFRVIKDSHEDGGLDSPDRLTINRSRMAALHFTPLRVSSGAIGVLATSGRHIDVGTLGTLAGVIAIALERAQLLDERKHAEMARRSEELKSALLASIGHDLRTPLTAIRVAASNLQSSWMDADARREQADVVLGEVERLNRLFQNILDMARIEAGTTVPNSRWVHATEVIATARDLVAKALRARSVTVRADDDPIANVDPRLTATALSHLLENAAQYSPPDSPIDVAASFVGDEIVFSVRDHGPGLRGDELAHVFDRFYRGGTSGRAHGVGMGLPIARGLLAAEQGRIWVENCVDGGARFSIAVVSPRRHVVTMEA